MNIESLKKYILSQKIEKKEYELIKNFCKDNNISIIDFFKIGNEYNKEKIEKFFTMALSMQLCDEDIIVYFIENQKKIKEVNIEKILNSYNKISKYQHLFIQENSQQLVQLVEEKNYEGILSLIHIKNQYKKSNYLKNLIITNSIMIEQFKTQDIVFHEDSYNQIDINYDKTNRQTEINPNFNNIDKFYDFIINNADKISEENKKNYLYAIMEYGAMTITSNHHKSLWDYGFIALIHEEQYPELKKEDKYMYDLIKYKEQILSEQEPYNTIKVINSLTAENKKQLLLQFIKNYKVEKYNHTACSIFYNFIHEVDDQFIKDFFKLGIEEEYIFINNMKNDINNSDYEKEKQIKKYKKENQYKIININSIALKNQRIIKNHEIIAKEILKQKYRYNAGLIDNFIKINNTLIEKIDFIISLNEQEYHGLIEELKEKNLPNIAKTVMAIRLDNKLKEKGIINKKMKI